MDQSTETTLSYIRGSVIRKILNHSTCPTCTDALIRSVSETNSSSFIIQMDFSGNSLLQPTSEMMVFFHTLLSVYMHHKPSFKAWAVEKNPLKMLFFSSLKVLRQKSYIIPFCEDHCDCYTKIMIQSTLKTFLKAFIHEMNEKFISVKSEVKPKNRKLSILTSN